MAIAPQCGGDALRPQVQNKVHAHGPTRDHMAMRAALQPLIANHHPAPSLPTTTYLMPKIHETMQRLALHIGNNPDSCSLLACAANPCQIDLFTDELQELLHS